MKTRALLMAIAVAELATGIGLLLIPSSITELLLGDSPGSEASLTVTRVAGLALISIGLICWLERAGNRGSHGAGLLIGLLVYNGAVPVLLVNAYAAGTGGIGLWPVVVLHLLFAIGLMVGLRSNNGGQAA